MRRGEPNKIARRTRQNPIGRRLTFLYRRTQLTSEPKRSNALARYAVSLVCGGCIEHHVRREPFKSTPMGDQSDFVRLSARTHVRPMGRTCGEPDEIKKNAHPKYFTAFFRAGPRQISLGWLHLERIRPLETVPHHRYVRAAAASQRFPRICFRQFAFPFCRSRRCVFKRHLVVGNTHQKNTVLLFGVSPTWFTSPCCGAIKPQRAALMVVVDCETVRS